MVAAKTTNVELRNGSSETSSRPFLILSVRFIRDDQYHSCLCSEYKVCAWLAGRIASYLTDTVSEWYQSSRNVPFIWSEFKLRHYQYLSGANCSLCRTWPDLVNHRVDCQIWKGHLFWHAWWFTAEKSHDWTLVKFVTDCFNCVVYGPICSALVDTESLRVSSCHTQNSCRTLTL